MELEQSFIALIEQSIKTNWYLNALTDYKGITLQYRTRKGTLCTSISPDSNRWKSNTRSFWVVDGEEVTNSFSSEGGIVFSMDELYYGRRSEEVVETLEETSARRIALDDLRTLFRTNLELANWGLIIHQNEYRRQSGFGLFFTVNGTLWIYL